MVLKSIREKLGKHVGLPWESIDSREGAAPTNWEGDEEGRWFLQSPPGDWNMEPLPVLAGTPTAGMPEDDVKFPMDAFDIQAAGEEEASPARGLAEKGGWTLVILCVGLGIIAACVVIPQADANRRLVYEREQLRMDLGQVQNQIAVNSEFLGKIESDPQLVERLAQREMHSVTLGQTVLDVKSDAAGSRVESASAGAERMSPFMIVNVPPPPALAPYKPVGGTFSELCREPRSQICLLGMGMFLVAGGLVLGSSTETNNGMRGSPGDSSGESVSGDAV